jgi:hypothetical protein
MPTTAVELRSKETALGIPGRPGRLGLARLLGPDYRLGFLFVLPIVLLVLALVAYPFGYAVYLSLTRKYVGMPPVFVGLENYVRLTFDGSWAWAWRWCSARASAGGASGRACC